MGYKNQFHHDWAKNKGSASVSFVFDPPESGCYKIEEYHPGMDPTCAQYMPSNAVLDVDYCKGLSATLSIDQSKKPAQWNEIASFMFFKGSQGKLTMRNSARELCDANSCFMIADAFRMTRIGASCPSPTTQGAPGAPAEKAAAQEGTLTLQFNVVDDALNARAVLQQSSNQVEDVLALHLGYKSVDIVKMQFRFLGSRRLLAGGPAHSRNNLQEVDMDFLARGEVFQRSPVDLKSALNAQLQKSGIEVVSAEIQMVPEVKDEDWSGFPLILVGWALLALTSLGLGTLAVRCYYRSRSSPAKAQTEQNAAKNVECVSAKIVDEAEAKDLEVAKPKDEETMSLGSNSTNAPISEEGGAATEKDMISETESVSTPPPPASQTTVLAAIAREDV